MGSDWCDDIIPSLAAITQAPGHPPAAVAAAGVGECGIWASLPVNLPK